MTRLTRVAILLVSVVPAWIVVTNATPAPDAQRRPTFAADIAPILLTSCARCHRPGQPAPFSLLSYDDVRAKGADIVKATQSRVMPPWLATQGPGFPVFQGDPRLTEKQIAAIKEWVDNGMPSGNLRRAPPPASFPLEWPLGLPDMTFALPRVISVSAGESDQYRNVVIPIRFPADLWIRAIDYQPSGAGVLRHARFFAAPPDLIVTDDDALPGIGGLLGTGSLENYGDQVLTAGRALIDLGGWVPALARHLLPEGLAIRLPARSNIIVNMHLRASPVDAVEDGRLAIYLSGPAARRAILPIDVPPALGIAAGIAVPAGESHYVLKDAFTLPIDVDAIGARAHANYLGRDMTMTAVLPTGSRLGLLRIARCDVDWPNSYFFVTPIHLPKGTTIQAEIVYDNSAGNPRNLFSPPRRVGWGRLSAGEMGSTTLLIVAPMGDDAQALDAAVAQHLRDQLLRRSTPGVIFRQNIE